MNGRKFYLTIFSCVLTLLLGVNAIFAQNCNYSLEMNDSFGDGWNNAFLTITVGGVDMIYTIETGSFDEVSIPVSDGDSIIVNYTGGIFDGEVSYFIYDSEGLYVWAGSEPDDGLQIATVATCPSCPTPTNVTVDYFGGVDADLSWDDGGVMGDYIIEYDTIGFTPGTGNVVTTTNSAITLENLFQGTAYEFYVTLVCSPTDSSNVIGPIGFETIWLIDVGISEILSPLNECGLASEEVEVIIKNYGNNPQSLIPIKYSVNGVDAGVMIPMDGLFTGVISRDSITQMAFETQSSFGTPGLYEIKAWTELEGDINTSNDTMTYFVTNSDYSDFPFFANLEEDDGGWVPMDISQNSSWAWGNPNGLLILDAASGDNAWVTNLEGNYNNSELSYLVSPCYDFSELEADPIIQFSINYNTETSWDGGWLEFSLDNEDTWTKIGAIGTGTNWYSFTNTITNLGDVWAGDSNGWLNAEHPLTGLAGESQCRLRFAFDSDGSVNTFDGIGIDDIYISPPLANDLVSNSVTNNSGECGNEDDQVSITVRNAGTVTQSNFDVSYQINGNPPVTETFDQSILPGDEATYTFTEPFNSAIFGGEFNIIAWTSLDTEQNIVNDTANIVFNTAVATPLPWVNDFEDIVIPPEWTVSDFTIGNGHGAPSYVIYDNLYGSDPDYEVITNNIGPINPGDSMTFDYRYVLFSDNNTGHTLGDGDSLGVYISTDCGNTFDLVSLIDQNNHIPTTDMANVTIDLDDYAGQVIVVRFYATWGTGDYYMDLDNINIQSCPFSFGSNISITAESSPGASDGAATVLPEFGVMPHTFLWSTGSTENNISGVPEGVYFCTITDANQCTELVEIVISACTGSLDIDLSTIGETTLGANDGAAFAIPNGGTSPYTFEWSNGSTNYSAEGLTSGIYEVTVIDFNGCSEVAEVQVDIFVGTENLDNLLQMNIAPNPASNQAMLNLTFNTNVDAQLSIVNLIGQKLYEKHLYNVQSSSEILDLSRFSEGMYLVRLETEGKVYLKKLMVQ